MLVVDLGKWMNKILIDWGIDAKRKRYTYIKNNSM